MDPVDNKSTQITQGGPNLMGLHETKAVTQAKIGEGTQKMISIHRGVTSGLTDANSKMASQDRLYMQVRLLGRSAVVSLAALNIAILTPVEYSFGKMASLSLSAMLFCLESFEQERKRLKGREFSDKNRKKNGLKRAESLLKQCGALIGFGAMAVLLGGVGSIAVGTAFSVQNSLSVQEEEL